jgi:hypothetical protein
MLSAGMMHHAVRADTLMMEAISTSKTWVNFLQTTQSNIPEDSHLQTYLSLQFKRPAFA